jgi:hypothetical protein
MNKVLANAITPMPGIDLTYEDANILLSIQRLYLSYIQWVRNYLISAFQNAPNQSATGSQLLLHLSSEIYNGLASYLGKEKAQQYVDIIYRFEDDNWALVNAYKNNDKTAIDLIVKQWFQLADEYAKFIYENFNNLSEAQWKDIVYKYINLKIQDVNALSSGNYDLEIKLYDQMQDMSEEFANNAAIGIIKKRHQKNPPADA